MNFRYAIYLLVQIGCYLSIIPMRNATRLNPRNPDYGQLSSELPFLFYIVGGDLVLLYCLYRFISKDAKAGEVTMLNLALLVANCTISIVLLVWLFSPTAPHWLLFEAKVLLTAVSSSYLLLRLFIQLINRTIKIA